MAYASKRLIIPGRGLPGAPDREPVAGGKRQANFSIRIAPQIFLLSANCVILYFD